LLFTIGAFGTVCISAIVGRKEIVCFRLAFQRKQTLLNLSPLRQSGNAIV
jgi:hypothetical protein